MARVRAVDQREIVARLSEELDRKHRLVRAQDILRMDSQRLSRYRFRHFLFQKYLYNSLDQVEREHLHEEVGTALEALYGEGAEEIAVQLARHFQEAGIVEKAVGYLHQAGNKAVRLSANQEAVAHFTRALELLETLPDTPERAQQELALQLAVGIPLQATKGYAASEVGRAYARAQELCQQIGETPQLFPALFLLYTFHTTRGQHQKALDIAEQVFSLAQRGRDPRHVVVAHLALGMTLLHMGELTLARGHLEQVIADYDPQQYRSLMFLLLHDSGVVCLSCAAWTLWFLGYPDQALKRSQEAFVLAQELDHPLSLAFALGIAGAMFHLLRREGQKAQKWIEALMRLSTEKGFVLYQAATTILQSWVQTEHGQFDEGIAQMHRGLATWQAIGSRHQYADLLALLAKAYGKAERAEEGLKVLAEALEVVGKTGERYYEAELHRIQGELLRMQSDETGAEVSFHQAIEIARRQQAKSWELRAAMSLSRLWQKQGKQE